MDKELEEKLKQLFDKLIAPRAKANGWSSLESRALYDDISKVWIVAVFYKQVKKLQSMILFENETQENAKKAVEVLNKLIKT